MTPLPYHTCTALCAPTKKPFDLTAVHVWTFRNGKAVRFEIYIDTPQVLAALKG